MGNLSFIHRLAFCYVTVIQDIGTLLFLSGEVFSVLFIFQDLEPKDQRTVFIFRKRNCIHVYDSFHVIYLFTLSFNV